MKIATSANALIANAAHESLNQPERGFLARSTELGFNVVGLGLLDVSICSTFSSTSQGLRLPRSPRPWSCSAWAPSSWPCSAAWAAASSPYADVGADLVGRRPASRGRRLVPATIADNVGDMGDAVAGMGADRDWSWAHSGYCLGASPTPPMA